MMSMSEFVYTFSINLQKMSTALSSYNEGGLLVIGFVSRFAVWSVEGADEGKRFVSSFRLCPITLTDRGDQWFGRVLCRVVLVCVFSGECVHKRVWLFSNLVRCILSFGLVVVCVWQNVVRLGLPSWVCQVWLMKSRMHEMQVWIASHDRSECLLQGQLVPRRRAIGLAAGMILV